MRGRLSASLADGSDTMILIKTYMSCLGHVIFAILLDMLTREKTNKSIKQASQPTILVLIFQKSHPNCCPIHLFAAYLYTSAFNYHLVTHYYSTCLYPRIGQCIISLWYICAFIHTYAIIKPHGLIIIILLGTSRHRLYFVTSLNSACFGWSYD